MSSFFNNIRNFFASKPTSSNSSAGRRDVAAPAPAGKLISSHPSDQRNDDFDTHLSGRHAHVSQSEDEDDPLSFGLESVDQSVIDRLTKDAVQIESKSSSFDMILEDDDDGDLVDSSDDILASDKLAEEARKALKAIQLKINQRNTVEQELATLQQDISRTKDQSKKHQSAIHAQANQIQGLGQEKQTALDSLENINKIINEIEAEVLEIAILAAQAVKSEKAGSKINSSQDDTVGALHTQKRSIEQSKQILDKEIINLNKALDEAAANIEKLEAAKANLDETIVSQELKLTELVELYGKLVEGGDLDQLLAQAEEDKKVHETLPVADESAAITEEVSEFDEVAEAIIPETESVSVKEKMTIKERLLQKIEDLFFNLGKGHILLRKLLNKKGPFSQEKLNRIKSIMLRLNAENKLDKPLKKDGRTVFHYVAMYGHTDVLEQLENITPAAHFEAMLNANSGNEGPTPLALAVMHSRWPMTERLLESGAKYEADESHAFSVFSEFRKMSIQLTSIEQLLDLLVEKAERHPTSKNHQATLRVLNDLRNKLSLGDPTILKKSQGEAEEAESQI